MLTLEEILSDVAALPEFQLLNTIKIDSRGADGNTPLHWMATLGDVKAIEILVRNGALIDVENNEGNTPLHEAVSLRHAHAASVLIRFGASIEKKNKAGMTAYDIARDGYHEPTKKLFE